MGNYANIISIPSDEWQIERIIGFDWNDGLIEGFCYFSYPEIEIYFKIYAYESSGCSFRTFTAYEITPETIEELGNMLSSEENNDFVDINNELAWLFIEKIKADVNPAFLFQSRWLDEIHNLLPIILVEPA
jgi:hypothetical protein